jgi:tetratricopeptide (TPR) repeat protein
MTQKERRAELLVKVDALKEEQAKHKKRKDQWLRWRKTQEMLGKSRWIKYHAWEFWEPETDEEDEPEPIVPKHDPNFQAMERDLQERMRKRKEKYLVAMKYKDHGNAKLKAGDYAGAVEDYAEGLENRKDMKALWANKALAELKLYRYRDAISSTSKVLEMSEIFDDGFEKDRDLNIKAFLRQAEGYRGLQEWKQAIEPLEQAVKLGSVKEAGD